MELREAIEQRASVRQFTQETVSLEDLREMVRLAGLAPSVNNSQPWRFICVTNKQLLEQMADHVQLELGEMLKRAEDPMSQRAKQQVQWFSTFFKDAPAVVAVLTRSYQAVVDDVLPAIELTHDEVNELRNRPDIQSLGACIENLLLAAVDLGYGACWMSGPLVARDRLETDLGVARPWGLAAMVVVGKPAAPPHQREKKPLEETIEFRA